MNNYLSFSEFLVKKRKEKNFSAKDFAFLLNISSVYMCDIEKGRKNAFSKDVLIKMEKILCDTDEEVYEFYDLFAASKGSVSLDLIDYIMGNKEIRKLLRIAKKKNVQNDVWITFINYLEDK